MLYEPPPDETELSAFGFKLSDYNQAPFLVWPENWLAYHFFVEYCITQWRTGMHGPTGLDHPSVLANLRTLRLPRAEADLLYADVRALERYSLTAMREAADE